jgi:hypothetical protein
VTWVMRLTLTHKKQSQKNHEVKFSIIQILMDKIEKKIN